MEPVVCSLVYLFRDNRICLPFSLSGPTKGRRSGYGGKQESGETIYQSGVRETRDETTGLRGCGGVEIVSMKKLGVMTFHWDRKVDPGINRPGKSDVEVHIYCCSDWHGMPRESTAFQAPQFFDCSGMIPYHEMMPCEEIWFSQLLLGLPFTGEMHYGKAGQDVFCRCAHLHKRPRQSLLAKP